MLEWLLFPTRSWRRNKAQLLHQAERVCLHPMLNYPAVDDTEDINNTQLNLFAGGRHAHVIAFMGPFKCFAGDYFVPLGDLVMNSSVQIRKGSQHHAKELFETLDSWYTSLERGMVIVAGVEQLVH